MRFTPAVEQLLAQAIQPLPLTRLTLELQTLLKAKDAERLFPNTANPQAALAGLALQLGDWEGSHRIAQDVTAREGSYWHAILHRMEPDIPNANYWFHQVGDHPIFADLTAGAEVILKENAIPEWKLKTVWSAAQFCSWTSDATQSGDPCKEAVARKIQQLEVEQLFSYCCESV